MQELGYNYVQNSFSHKNTAVANNSLIVANLYNCGSCSGDVDVYCYSNSTLSNVGFVISENGKRLYYNTTYYSVSTFTVHPSGIQIIISNSTRRYYSGIYTCVLPDSEGNTLEASIAIYEIFPSVIKVLFLRL